MVAIESLLFIEQSAERLWGTASEENGRNAKGPLRQDASQLDSIKSNSATREGW